MSRDVFQRLFEKLKKFFNTPLSILEYFPSSTCWGVRDTQKKLGLLSPLEGIKQKKIMHYLLDICLEYVTIYLWLIKEKI